MRNLSREAFDHDDPNHGRHGRDKQAKKARDAVDFVPIPSPIRIGGKELTGIDFDPDSAGFMFQFGNAAENTEAALGKSPIPLPQRVDSKVYRKRILSEEKTRRRFRRVVARNGQDASAWGYHKCGGLSLVVTVPPWSMTLVNQMEDDIRDKFLLEVAHAASEKMKEVSGRVPWGGGLHLDTGIAHIHFQIPKTNPEGVNWEKAKFKTGGPWLVGADRIDRKFPDLLSKKQREIMQGHKTRKGQLVDLEIASAVDDFMEKRFRQMGLEKDYEESCRDYVVRKKKAQDTERDRHFLRESFRYFAVGGVWPLAASIMRFAMWRLIPKDYRKLVMTSMRMTQIIESPLTKSAFKFATKEIIKKLTDLPEPVMTGPGVYRIH